MNKFNSLLSASLRKHLDRPALSIDGQLISYRAIDGWSRRFACRLQGKNIGIVAGRSLDTYAGVLAVARSGRTYVPLNAEFPDHRLLEIFSNTAIETVIVDRQHIDRACAFLRLVEKPIRILVMESELSLQSTLMCQQHHIDQIREELPSNGSLADAVDDDEIPLYILSTSGSTGAPKRIAIPRSNVADYLGAIDERFDFGPNDRFSHFFKLSFDLSVHDLFVTWTNGGCLYVPGANDLLDPTTFARRHGLTVWFSVPSLVGLAMLSRKLKADTLPDLRQALFCGEALSWEAVDAFKAAAPNAAITNLYGPTEATIAITGYLVDKNEPIENRVSGSVPIGRPFTGQEVAVVDSNLSPLPYGKRGELLLGGSQLAPGYLGNPEQTKEAFVDLEFPSMKSKQWYRTGDIVMQTEHGLVFLGRCDTQIKFRGHRIELGEIEAVLQRVAKTPLAVVIAWPPLDTGPIDRLLAFIMPPHATLSEIHATMRDQLPAHMVPARILSLDHPIDTILNDNRKIDRAKVAEMYQGTFG